MEIKEISVTELKELREQNVEHQLIDVRKVEEFEFCNLDGKLIPMHEVPQRFEEIDRNAKVIVHCHHGGRSKKVIAWLQLNHGFENLYNLAGGIHSWSEEIDPEVPIY